MSCSCAVCERGDVDLMRALKPKKSHRRMGALLRRKSKVGGDEE